MNEYLDKLKPKLVKYKTSQEIFDHVIRALVKQRVPCIRIDDITRRVDIVCFNSSAHTSPILTFFTRDDLACMKKLIGYQTLQDFDGVDLRSVLLGPDSKEGSSVHEDYMCMSETEKEIALKIVELLNLRGLSKEGIELLCKLENAHNRWFSDLNEEKFESQTKYDSDSACMYVLHATFSRVAYTNSLKEEVLKFAKP